MRKRYKNVLTNLVSRFSWIPKSFSSDHSSEVSFPRVKLTTLAEGMPVTGSTMAWGTVTDLVILVWPGWETLILYSPGLSKR